MQPADLQRLIQIIVEELAAAGEQRRRRGAPATRCCTSAVPIGCAVSSTPAPTRLGMHAAGGATAAWPAMIDHTLLKPDATRQRHRDAVPRSGGVRVRQRLRQPHLGGACARLLRGRGVRVCSVVGFPLGATTPDTKHYETRRAIFDGAREIDMVINVGALKSGDLRVVERDIEAVTGPCREAGALSKVIIEAALLTDEEKVTACTLAKAAGGRLREDVDRFRPRAARPPPTWRLMRRVVGEEMGVKAAGGVRDLEGLKAMVAAGATRIGASAGVRIVQESRGHKTDKGGTGY